MVRIGDRIWNHVEKTDEVWKCRFCDHVFAKGTAAQIVKCHLAGLGGPGTKFCSDVPGHVKMEARREMNEGEKKRRIVMSTSPSNSSNVTVEVSPKNDGERMIEQETKLRSRDGGVVERESDQEMKEAEFPAVMVKNGDSVCEICRHVYERRTPATRMQWHLAEIGGSGDTICTSTQDDVKGAIPPKISGSKRKRCKTMPGSSHTEDVPTMSIKDVALEDLHDEADHGVRDEKMVEVEDASVKDSREEETTGVPPGDLWQPPEKDHEQSGDPTADVIALSPTTLMATNRFVCEICNQGFQRDQNLQMHRRNKIPWKLRQRISTEVNKRVYICPEPTCVHHNPARALGDLTGIKKHFSRKHGEKKWKCDHEVRDEKMVEVEDASVKDSREEETTGVPPGDLRQPPEKDHEQSGDIAKGNIAMDDRNVWRHLRNDNDISWVCQFCGHPFPWDVQPETFRHHLTRMCERAPEDAEEAAQRREVEAAECSKGNIAMDVMKHLRTKLDNSSFECEFCGHPFPWSVTITKFRRHLAGVQGSISRITICPSVPEDVREAAVVQNAEDNQETRESAWTTKRLVGEAFVKNEGKIWSWLMDDQVLRVDIYGMGGVGKTTLMRHIQTRLKGQSSLKVYWVTVSQDFSIWKLQNLIAKKIGFNFSEKEDVVERAEELTQSLKAKGKCVLILDDLWNYFNIDDVGIPVEVNACKLVLTTRDLKVCRQMLCSKGNRIQLKPLSKEEAWILFTQELGDYIPEVEELAKAISRECDGLPLGIKVMARTMKEIREVHAWRNALEELKEVKSLQMRDEVFSVLKFSFLRLKDPARQECLLYCALFPEDAKIGRDELIKYMIVEGIINERSRQAELDKGHAVLDTLQNACLLEGDNDDVWMHDLIRDMTIHELRERSNTLVEAGLQLQKLPDVENWREDLVRVSLIGNELGVIPYGHTRRCPNLSTLLLRDNRKLKRIANSFFKQFQKLKVLDLSHCLRIKVLPGSISNLVNLTALLLSGCSSLSYVPSLVKLEKLKVLDLCGCDRLKEMPEGVKFLPKLNYLDLSEAGVGMRERESEISKFVGREVGELRMLKTLYCDFRNLREFDECIESQERSQQSLSHYNFYIGRRQHFERKTTLKSVSIRDGFIDDPVRLPTDIEALSIFRCDCTFYKRLFPPSILSCLRNLQEISVERWDAIEEIFAVKEDNINTALVQFLSSYHSTHSLSNHSLLNLKVIHIWSCDELKKLFPPSLLPNLHNLQEIKVGYCHVMEEIFSTDQEDGQELSFAQSINNNHYPLNLPKLTILVLHDLPELRNIYKGAINCHSLQEIRLVECPKMERVTLPLPQPSLRRISVYPMEWWESVQWGSANDKIHLQSLVGFRIW